MAFELNNKNDATITVWKWNMSIYCLDIHHLPHIVCTINISDCSKC